MYINSRKNITKKYYEQLIE